MDEDINSNGDMDSPDKPQSFDMVQPAESEPETTEVAEVSNETEGQSESVTIPVTTDKPQSFDMVQPTANTTSETSTEAQPAEESKPDVDIVRPEEIVAAPVVVASMQTAKPAKKSMLKKLLVVLLVLVLMASSAAAAYYYRDKIANDFEAKQATNLSTSNASVDDLRTQLTAETAKYNALVAAQTTPTSVAPNAATIANIKSAITSANTAALEGYMASSVNVVIAASDGVGVVTPTKAVTNITSFIADATSPWDFSLSASILSSYGKGSYKQYFPNNAVVGKSANSKVISFSFDANAKISTVFMSANENILD